MAWLQSNPSSGITSNVYTGMLGLLPAAWSLLGYDSTAHMIEETQEADATAGWSMPYAVWISAVSGFPYIFALTLCVQVVLSVPALVSTVSKFCVHPVIAFTCYVLLSVIKSVIAYSHQDGQNCYSIL